MTTEFFDKDNYKPIPAEKLEFALDGVRITDKKFEDKPVGYFKDAWKRFCKNKASIVAAIIILCIFAYAIFTPFLIRSHDSKFIVSYYSKKPTRISALYDLGFNGSTKRSFTEKSLLAAYAIGMGAEDGDGKGDVTLGEALQSEFQPIVKITGESTQLDTATKQNKSYYEAKIDTYLEVGFKYLSVEQEEYRNMLKWQEETGKQLIYPLIQNNEFCFDINDANYWYKTRKANPVKVGPTGKASMISYVKEDGSFDLDFKLEDNYKRDSEGRPVYYEPTGGGSIETCQYKVRVLFYNYYQYLYNSMPDYILGTDSQGYDLALRMADGVKLSLLVAVFVSVINFIIGAAYGAVEGYYGGAVDIIMERISDILVEVPFIVVATLFQIHLADKVGPLVSLLFAFVLTGWIGTASRVRTQFYRFKNQEYVMAARTLGASDKRIIWKHIFPNSLGTIITSSVLVIPGVIFSESMLSFLGIVKLGGSGITSLGTLLSDASTIWTNYPHLMLFPALIISLLEISFNLFGNGLRDAFNPSLRGVED